jgi:hypothetical protein
VTSVRVQRWVAWAPGLESAADGRVWARDPRPVPEQGAPDARFLPTLQRRRCDSLSRMMLHVVNQCCDEALRRQVACVFASRHGSFGTTASLLEDVAAATPLSPARFSHSVHNTQAGLFSIWSGNPRPSTSVAAGGKTFAHGFLEAIGMLHRECGRPVLFVVGDEVIPEPFSGIAREPRGAHAVALLLGAEGTGEGIEFSVEVADDESPPAEWPDALEFLRWWLSGAATLRLARRPHAWVWRRVAG